MWHFFFNLSFSSERFTDLGAAGGILSTANDMAKWINMHIKKGNNSDGETVVKESILQPTYTPLNTMPPAWSQSYVKPNTPVTHVTENYGLGWMIGKYSGTLKNA